MPLLALLTTLAPAHAALGAMLALLPPARAQSADPEDEPPVRWAATEATYTVAIPSEGPLTVTLEWRLAAPAPGWAELPLAGPNLVVREASGPVVSGPGGLFAVLAPDAPRALRVTGTLDPARPGAAELAVLPAGRQRVVIDAPGLDVTVKGAQDGWLSAEDRLVLSWAPRRDTAPAAPSAPLVRAEASTAVWAEPGALLSRTVARWTVLRGATDRFELDVTGLDDVQVDANVARTTREGNRLVLHTRAPIKGAFEARILTRLPVADDRERAAPAPRPIASRVARYWTLGRAEDGELVPLGGPRAVPGRDVPAWGRGLSDTPVLSTWEGDAPLRVRLAKFNPLMGPDTVVERAQLVVASAVEGRSLVRTTWHVRNERKQYLHVTPPPGLRAVTARVSGEPVAVLSDGATGLYVPLEKSVETVQGLLTFPVEVTWIAEGEAWAKKGDRTLRLPAIDAPIQAAEWEVYLPRGVTAKGAAEAAPPPEVDAGEEAVQAAVEAYKKNDFTTSNAYLEQARAVGSTNANVDRLQSNLDALLSKDAAPDDVATRRVRELANARTLDQQVVQEKKAEEARRALQAGDVEKAEAYLEDVVAIAEEIAVTEQKESTVQADKKSQALELLAEVKKQKASKAGSSLGAGGKSPPQRPPSAATSSSRTQRKAAADGDDDARDEGGVVFEYERDESDGVFEPEPGELGAPATGRSYQAEVGALDSAEPAVSFDFEDVELEGELTRPDAALIVEPAPAPAAKADPVPVSGRTPAARAPAARGPARSSTAAVPPPPPPPPAPAVGGAPAAPTPRDGRSAAAAKPAQQPHFEAQERPALDVKAAPLTLAMPLTGPVVRATTALLPAGEAPSLTIPYRTTGDPR